MREYNLFAIFRLHADVAGLQRYADSVVAIPRLRVRALVLIIVVEVAFFCFIPTPCPAAARQDELAEPAQFCDLLVTSALDAAGDPQRRHERFPALSPGRLAAALSRYRELDSQSMLMGRHHPRMPQVRDVFCVHHFPCGHTTAPGVSYLGSPCSESMDAEVWLAQLDMLHLLCKPLQHCRRPLDCGQHLVLEANVRASILSAAQELIKRRAVDTVIRKLRTEAAAMQQ